MMSDSLYLACYVVDTVFETLNRRSPSSPPTRPPYFLGNNYRLGDDLKSIVLEHEAPEFLVTLDATPPDGMIYADVLDEALILHKIEQDELDRWCLIDETEKRHGIVLFYFLSKKDFIGINRETILSKAYNAENFYSRYLEQCDREAEKIEKRFENQRLPLLRRRTGTGQRTKSCDGDGQSEQHKSSETKTNDTKGKERFNQYKKTAPLVVHQFLEKIASIRQRSAPSEDALNGRSKKMWDIEQEADQYWPPDGENREHWISRRELADTTGHSMNTLRQYATKRCVYRAADKLSGWDHDRRYWRSKTLSGAVYYYEPTKGRCHKDDLEDEI